MYFTTNSDGNNTEGIGAMAQYQIICYILSKLYNTKYYFTGFKNLTHYQYFNTTQKQWSKDITKFFNLPVSKKSKLPVVNFSETNYDLNSLLNQNIILNIEPNYLLQFIDDYIDNLSVQSILKEIGNNIKFNNKLYYFNKEKQNIAIHIRKYTQTDCDPHPNRELFDESKKDYYINLVNLLNSNDSIFHIYSQGNDKDFNFLKRDNVVLHIEEHPLTSLYHMINADMLVTANSSFIELV